jgi:hypothetical protein
MGRGRGGAGGGGGLAADATGGTMRQIAGKRMNTADVVNQAISTGKNDLPAAREALRKLGHANPSESVVQNYATQARVLGNIERITGARTTGQIGKWDFSSAKGVLSSMEKYLWRRKHGQGQRWTAAHPPK